MRRNPFNLIIVRQEFKGGFISYISMPVVAMCDTADLDCFADCFACFLVRWKGELLCRLRYGWLNIGQVNEVMDG